MAHVSSAIILDTTLRDLYAIEADGDLNIALVSIVPSAEVQLKQCMPLPTRFIYQSPLSGPEDTNFLGRIHLQVVPQHYSFMAGRMPLYLIDIDENPEFFESSENKSTLLGRSEIKLIFRALSMEQQPDVYFSTRPGDLLCPASFSAAISSPMDCFSHLPHLIDPEAHYELQSKRALAVSDVPTPATQIIDNELRLDQPWDPSMITSEIKRVVEYVRTQRPPFVLKMQQSLGSQGTILVRNPDDVTGALRIVQRELERLLPLLNETNHHLRVSTVLIQEMIPGDAVALSLFITPSGRPIYISCCDQLLDSDGQWVGGRISYLDQGKLEAKYGEIAEQLARFSHEKGYHGPLGADIMTDAKGRHLVIDLNPRVSGTSPLGVLRGHFSLRRGLQHAGVLCPLFLRGTRENLERAFNQEIHKGSLIVTGWSYDPQYDFSSVALIMAAENQDRLAKFINRINMFRHVF